MTAMPRGGSRGPFGPDALVLGVKTRPWRMEGETESACADEEFRALRPDILERDGHACVFCGFRAGKWQEVHHLDGDHRNNDRANLVTACPYCHAVFHVGLAGRRGAFLAHLPEVSQAMVSHLWRAVAVARSWHGSDGRQTRRLRDASRRMEDFLRARASHAAALLGTSDPAVLGEALLECARLTRTPPTDGDALLRSVRLVPPGEEAGFGNPRMIEYYLSSEGPFREGALGPRTWEALWREWRARAGGG